LRLLDRELPSLTALAFEELARTAVSRLGTWEPAGRWWQGSQPEWDVVSRDGGALLVGEVKAWRKPATQAAVSAEVERLLARPLPELGFTPKQVERVLFVPAVARGVRVRGARLVTLDALLAD
jgi:hypothetical protein